MNPYRSLVQRLGRTRAFSRVASLVLPPIDARFRARRRSLTSLGTGLPLCYLTTTGRRTGALRTVPLLYVADGERVVVFASNWGKPQHPGWSANLDACPTGTVTIAGVERPVLARRASADERQGYWAAAERIYPGYAGYRRRAGRDVRVYVLEPQTAT